jgi:hypothetical protein
VRVMASRQGSARGQVTITGQGYSMTFDDHTGALHAGSTGVFFDQGSAGTVVAQGMVSSLNAIPKGVAPVHSVVAHAPTITLAPHRGTATTRFTLRVGMNHTPADATTAPAVTAAMFGPTGPNCAFWASRPPFAHLGLGSITRSASAAIATYQITPDAIGRRTWCPGRYQLMLSPITTTHRHSTVPRSFAAAYFDIH